MSLSPGLKPIPGMFDRGLTPPFAEAAVVRLETQLRHAFVHAELARDEAQEAIGDGINRGDLAVALHDITTAMEQAKQLIEVAHDRLRRNLPKEV